MINVKFVDCLFEDLPPAAPESSSDGSVSDKPANKRKAGSSDVVDPSPVKKLAPGRGKVQFT